MGIESKLIDRLALANARYDEADHVNDETESNRASNHRFRAEEAVMAIKSKSAEVKNAKLRILARRTADDFPWVSQHLAAIAG